MEGLSSDSPFSGPWDLRWPLSLMPSESAPRLVVSAAREPQTLMVGSRLRVSRTALSILFLFQRVAGKFLKTCSLFMSLMLGSWPLLISGLAAALFNIRSNLPPPPPSTWGRMDTIVFSACRGRLDACWVSGVVASVSLIEHREQLWGIGTKNTGIFRRKCPFPKIVFMVLSFRSIIIHCWINCWLCSS